MTERQKLNSLEHVINHKFIYIIKKSSSDYENLYEHVIASPREQS